MHGLKFPDYLYFLNSGDGNLYYLSKCLVNQPWRTRYNVVNIFCVQPKLQEEPMNLKLN